MSPNDRFRDPHGAGRHNPRERTPNETREATRRTERGGSPERTGEVLMHSDLAEVLAQARAASLSRLPLSEAELRDDAERRFREGRLRNLERYQGMITIEDVDRIVYDRLNSVAWERAVLPFMHLWKQRKKNFLWIGGDVGLGKTVAALGMLATHSGILISGGQIERAMRVNTDLADKMREQAKNARVLILDDVLGGGTEEKRAKSRAAQEEHIFELVNERINGHKATILTSNLTKGYIEKNFEKKLLSRVGKDRGVLVELQGHDARDTRTGGHT